MTPPSTATRSVEGRVLTAAECTRARCDAARLLRGFGLATGEQVNTECASFMPVCGNGVRESDEQCDDGANGVRGDGCRDDCTAERCGDFILDPGEQCDTNDPVARENCSLSCRTCDECNVCGDGAIGLGEACDDGNAVNGDGCSNQCVIDGLI